MLRVLALLLALCGIAHSEESSPRESKDKATQGDNQYGGGPQQITVPANSATPTIINIQTGKHSGHERECAKPKDWKEWAAFAWCKVDSYWDAERTIAAFTVILAISTTLLWWATRKLYLAGERQMELIEQSSVAQSRDMQASVAAASEANRISAEALHASQRAWVTSESVADSDLTWDEKGCRLVIKTTIKNIGTAPAQDVDIQVKIYARPDNKPVGIDEALREPRSKAVGHLLFPSAELSPSRRLVLTREQIEASNRTDLVIHIAVIVRYHSNPAQKEGRTVRFYDVQQIPGEPEDEAVVALQPIKLDEDARQDSVWLTYHWMPSYAD
jgi:hypothetical protein